MVGVASRDYQILIDFNRFSELCGSTRTLSSTNIYSFILTSGI